MPQPGERSKTWELLKLKDWRSKLCSNVGGTNLSSPRHEAWVSLTQLPQYMKHKRGCLHGKRTQGCPKVCQRSHAALCLLQRAGRMCAGSPGTPMSNVTAWYQQCVAPSPAAGVWGAALQLVLQEALASALQEKERFPTAG